MKADMILNFSGTVQELHSYLESHCDFKSYIQFSNAKIEAIENCTLKEKTLDALASNLHCHLDRDQLRTFAVKVDRMLKEGKLQTIKEVRTWLGCGLKEAKDLVESYIATFPGSYTVPIY